MSLLDEKTQKEDTRINEVNWIRWMEKLHQQ